MFERRTHENKSHDLQKETKSSSSKLVNIPEYRLSIGCFVFFQYATFSETVSFLLIDDKLSHRQRGKQLR